MANKFKEEPKTAPESDRWYEFTLGSSFKNESSNKYCTLRYEFKPASVDKTKPGLLRKTKENRVSVEFQNNQIGKGKVMFEGNSEEYKENDAVLFFDGETFRLERLHRAVKQLRHLRVPGESAAVAAVAVPTHVDPNLDPRSPPIERSSPVEKSTKSAFPGRNSFQAVPVEVERIDIGEPGNTGIKSGSKRPYDDHPAEPPIKSGFKRPYDDHPAELPIKFDSKRPYVDHPVEPINSAGAKNDVEEHQDIDMNDLFGRGTPDNIVEEKDNLVFDVNVPHTDDEIADVVDGGDEVDKGPNAADALRAQVNEEGRDEETSTSSGGSESSDSDNGSSSTDSECSDDEDSFTSI